MHKVFMCTKRSQLCYLWDGTGLMGYKMETEEILKVQHHLKLLREEYVKLQNKYVDLERKYQLAVATLPKSKDEFTFVSRLLKTVADLFEKDLYSDLTVKLNGQHIRAHRFVLAARSDHWGVPSLGDVEEIDLSALDQNVGYALLRWIYTDDVVKTNEETFLLNLMKSASHYHLGPLVARCETMLMPNVGMKNCIALYTVAEEIDAEGLKNHCSQLISNYWDDFTDKDFAHMSAPLLYKMFKAKCSHPLHIAIRMRREDVVFLFLMEFDSQLSVKLNEFDGRGDLPLDLALVGRQSSIAQTLISHEVDINARDGSGCTLLHKAIQRGDEFSAAFLLAQHVSINDTLPGNCKTALHLLAESAESRDIEGMSRIAHTLLEKRANCGLKDDLGNTALHLAIRAMNHVIFDVILDHGPIDLENINQENDTPLWLALEVLQNDNDPSFAQKLIIKGSSPDSTSGHLGDSLLHRCIKAGYENAALFLAASGAKINYANRMGESPLHVACARGLVTVCVELLRKGGNSNQQTVHPGNSPASDGDVGEASRPVFRETPLHVAIRNRQEPCIRAILDHKAFTQRSTDNTLVVPNYNVQDSESQTALGLAIIFGQQQIAQDLLAGGASINVTNRDGLNLLHQAIIHQETKSVLFLLENGADTSAVKRAGEATGSRVKRRNNQSAALPFMYCIQQFAYLNHMLTGRMLLKFGELARTGVSKVLWTAEDKTPLQLAISHHLPTVVEALCNQGVDVNAKDVNLNPPLWLALESGQEEIASILVNHGCDTDSWGPGPEGCYQTLLHKAIDENNESVACFLVRSDCDKDSPRRLGLDGRGGDEAFDLQSPLHLACSWGLESVVQTLMEHGAAVNAQDAEGKSPLHVAIVNQHSSIISLMLAFRGLDLGIRDKQGHTPFTIAMVNKNNKAAQAILNREPKAAEQYNNKGLNFLHIAIQKSDIESVLFLLSIHVNIHSRVRDQSQLTPLHLAVQAGSDIIVRNLLLAGSNVNDLTSQKQNSLHLAAALDHSTICTILLENGVNFDDVDDNLNNALHVAVHKGYLMTVKVLLTESRINAEAINMRGQNPLHVLAQNGKENSAAIFEFFMECMPDYPISKFDVDGNTALLLAYMNGNGVLCRAIVRAGACLGTVNRNGVSIFNHQVATKQLLFKLLDLLSKEPPWTDGDFCLECCGKFGIATRKHHCRHCGRLLCSKCSDKEMPILKFKQNKPVRVCELCFDVLTLGSS